MSTARRKNRGKSAAAASSSSKKRKQRTAAALLDLSAGGFDDDDDSVVSSSSDEDEDDDDETPSVNSERDDDDDDNAHENLEVKKVRLAREYLDAIARRASDDDESESESEAADESADHDDDYHDDPIARKLQRQRLQQAGAWKRDVADALQRAVMAREMDVARRHPGFVALSNNRETLARLWIDSDSVAGRRHVRLRRGHDLTPTAVGLASATHQAVSGAKDHSVLLWDVATETKLAVLCPPWKKQQQQPKRQPQQQPRNRRSSSQGSSSSNVSDRSAGQVGSVACADDGRLAAVGRRGGAVQIWDLRSRQLAHTFTGHKGPVTGLAFAGSSSSSQQQQQQQQLFSASSDRCLRHYDLKDLMYLETLYGHQSGVAAVDCYRNNPVSVGADRTARYWKLAQDTHCIYRGGARLPAADAVAALRDDWFVTGHVDGTVALWRADRKRAVAVARPEETTDNHTAAAAAAAAAGVVSISCVRGSDAVATGSSDGRVRFWKAALADRTIEPLCHVPLHGFVNGLALHPDATYCVAAVGQEHRCGRWERVPRAKNRIAFISLLDQEKGKSRQEPEEQPPAAGEEEEDDDNDNNNNDQASSASSSVSEAEDDEKVIDYDALD